MLIAFSGIEGALLLFARERLTRKQKQILHVLDEWQALNATQLSRVLSKKLGCSQTAVWNNINSLKRAGLISCGTVKDKGKAVALTDAGGIIIKGGIENEK